MTENHTMIVLSKEIVSWTDSAKRRWSEFLSCHTSSHQYTIGSMIQHYGGTSHVQLDTGRTVSRRRLLQQHLYSVALGPGNLLNHWETTLQKASKQITIMEPLSLEHSYPSSERTRTHQTFIYGSPSSIRIPWMSLRPYFKKTVNPLSTHIWNMPTSQHQHGTMNLRAIMK